VWSELGGERGGRREGKPGRGSGGKQDCHGLPGTVELGRRAEGSVLVTRVESAERAVRVALASRGSSGHMEVARRCSDLLARNSG